MKCTNPVAPLLSSSKLMELAELASLAAEIKHANPSPSAEYAPSDTSHSTTTAPRTPQKSIASKIMTPILDLSGITPSDLPSEVKRLASRRVVAIELPRLLALCPNFWNTLTEAFPNLRKLSSCDGNGTNRLPALINSPFEGSASFLTWALENNHPEMARTLVAAGAALDVKNAQGFTPAELAAYNDQFKCFSLFAIAGDDLSAFRSQGTPLMVAIRYHNKKSIDALLLQQVRISTAEINCAIMDGGIDLIHLLCTRLQPGAINALAPKESYLPLGMAAQFGRPTCLNVLLNHGADVNAIDAEGRTALWIATKNADLECMRILIEAGADVNIATPDGITPLMQAAAFQPIRGFFVSLAQEMIVLLAKGKKLDVNRRSAAGRTAADYALGSNPLVAELLLHHLNAQLSFTAQDVQFLVPARTGKIEETTL